jgi:hypothetical protein
LTIAIAAIMAARALLLVFLVSGAQFSGHEERLWVHCFTAPGRYQTQEHSQHYNRLTFSSPHVASRMGRQ